jgi:hypothetical protein
MRPSVDVFIPTCGEPLTILQHTLTAAVNRLCEKGSVLDDATSSGVRMLADRKVAIPARADPNLKSNPAFLKRESSSSRSTPISWIGTSSLFVNLQISPCGSSKAPRSSSCPKAIRLKQREPFYKVMQPGKDNDNSLLLRLRAIYRRTAPESVGVSAIEFGRRRPYVDENPRAGMKSVYSLSAHHRNCTGRYLWRLQATAAVGHRFFEIAVLGQPV